MLLQHRSGPFRTGMEVLEDFHSINIFTRSTMLFKSWIIMLFIKSLIVFCGLPLVLLLFTLHMSFCLYMYKGKSNNKTEPSLVNVCSWIT